MHSSNVRHLLARRHRGEKLHVTPATASHPTQSRHREIITPKQLIALLAKSIAKTEIVLGIGYGVSPAALRRIEELAERLGATIYGTRPAVDAGYIPHERMVGRTGISIAPAFYIAFGISGDRLHTAGLDQAKCIVAINTDPTAPLCKLADYLIAEDAQLAAEAILKELNANRTA